MKNILFRCDASSIIGSGHVLRCLMLARALSKRKANVTFICRKQQGDLIKLISDEFKVIKLEDQKLKSIYNATGETLKGKDLYSKWLGCSQTEDAEDTLQKLNEENIPSFDWVIVDHYGLDVCWERYVRKRLRGKKDVGPKVLAIDDLANRKHDASIILDQNFFGKDQELRYRFLVPNNCCQLMGPHYALIGEEYRKMHNKLRTRSEISRILVYFGGSANNKYIELTIKALKNPRFKSLCVDVVLGCQNKNDKKIRELVMSRQKTRIHKHLKSLSKLILDADVAIGAAGGTTWERACLDLPSLVITVADNQIPFAEVLHEYNYINLIGKSNEITKEKITNSLLELIDKRKKLRSGKELTDGYGAVRIANKILGVNKIFVRTVREDDERLLYRWANDSSVRLNSFTPKPINYKEHQAWLKKSLNDPNRMHLIAIDADGCGIGQIRLDKEQDNRNVKIAISVDKAFRGQGLSKELLLQGLTKMQDRWLKIEKLIALVLTSNKASIKLFHGSGFLTEKIINQNGFEALYLVKDNNS